MPKMRGSSRFLAIPESAESKKRKMQEQQALERKKLFEEAKRLDKEIKELDRELDSERVTLRTEAAKIPLTDWEKKPHGEMVHYKSETSHQGRYGDLISMIIEKQKIESELFPEKELMPRKPKKN